MPGCRPIWSNQRLKIRAIWPLRKICDSPVSIREPERPVAARQRDGIGLDRQIVGQHQVIGLGMFDLGADQQKLVAGIAVDLAGFKRAHPLVAVLHGEHRQIEAVQQVLLASARLRWWCRR